jgi:hypothetical protein
MGIIEFFLLKTSKLLILKDFFFVDFYPKLCYTIFVGEKWREMKKNITEIQIKTAKAFDDAIGIYFSNAKIREDLTLGEFLAMTTTEVSPNDILYFLKGGK